MVLDRDFIEFISFPLLNSTYELSHDHAADMWDILSRSSGSPQKRAKNQWFTRIPLKTILNAPTRSHHSILISLQQLIDGLSHHPHIPTQPSCLKFESQMIIIEPPPQKINGLFHPSNLCSLFQICHFLVVGNVEFVRGPIPTLMFFFCLKKPIWKGRRSGEFSEEKRRDRYRECF
jgi:hypothetical protein